MKFHPSNFFQLPLATIVLFLSFSCNKDSDLLAEYVVENPESFLTNDVVITLSNNPIIIKPLSNDKFDKPEEVVITEVTPPKMGTAEVQGDNTVLYTPNADESGTDEFDYTTTVTNPDSSVSTATGSISVTVTPTSKTPTDPNAVNFSKYGAVGDGVTDDTAALKKAFENETNLISDANKTYLISSTLYLNKNMINTIDFNGSTITRNAKVHFMIDIDKRKYGNTLTTIRNLILDGNDKGGSGIDIASRVHLQNVEIKDIIHNNANGIRSLIYNLPGCYGQWVFDNVDIHDLEPVGNDGNYGNDLGAAHGWIASVQQIPSQTTQIVYKNSSLHSIWGEDAGAITTFSAGLDISNTPVSFWFENINVADAQRRAVKGFTGNQTWINSTFTSAAYDNPNIIRTMPSAGLFVIGPGSSSTGGSNNVICGCTFQGHPDDPFDSFYTRVIMTGDLGPSGLKISNSTFTGANPQSHPDNGFTAFGPNLKYLSIDNSTFGTQNGIRLVGNFADYARISTNNKYVDGKTATFARTSVSYTTPTIPFVPCPTIE